jgi:hypothetical protein
MFPYKEPITHLGFNTIYIIFNRHGWCAHVKVGWSTILSL